MGQPIHLEREGETMTVYGHAQAKIMRAQGWRATDNLSMVAVSGADDLTVIAGVGEAVAAILANAGYKTYQAIADAPAGDLVALDRISSKTVVKIQDSAAKLAAEIA